MKKLILLALAFVMCGCMEQYIKDYGVVKVHCNWLQSCEKEGLKIPYDIDEMIEATHRDYKGGKE